jgi:hypothetical protein
VKPALHTHAPLALQVPWPLQVVAASQNVHAGPKKPAAQEAQVAPANPLLQAQPPLALQVP